MPGASSPYILDASAILCLLNGEEGAARVADVLANTMVSAVNLSEVAAKLTGYGIDRAGIEAVIEPLDLDIAVFDAEQAIVAAVLKPMTRPAGLSLGDRACLALARIKSGTALTADRIWADVGRTTGIAIEILR